VALRGVKKNRLWAIKERLRGRIRSKERLRGRIRSKERLRGRIRSKALDRGTRRTVDGAETQAPGVAWVLGNRDTATFRRL
jgi:hypothetical protein